MFKAAAILVGIVNFAMGLIWFFEPQIPLTLWGIVQTSQDMVVERRLGIVIIIYSLVLFFSCNAPPSPARSAISYAVVFGGIAVGTMNVYDLFYSGTSSGIASAIGINYLTSLAFALIEWRTYRDRKQAEASETAS
ncbi:MAG: hypothetical protein IT473_06645 [Lysobacter sp.]|nr:hypothetical protein [Lysobacter sp.]